MMKKLFAASLFALIPIAEGHAQEFRAKVVTTCGSPPADYAGASGNFLPPTMDVTGVFCSTPGGGSGVGAVYGPNATGTAPTQPPILESGLTGAGNIQPFGVDIRGALITPNVAAAGTTITKCSIGATSATATCQTYVGTGTGTAATVVCPAATNLQSEEIRTNTAGIALSLVGNTLTTATDGTGAGTPDVVLPTANTLYTLPVPQTNAVSGYNGTAGAAITICIQKARQ